MARPQHEGLGPSWASGFGGSGPSFALKAFSLWASVGRAACPPIALMSRQEVPKLRSGRHQNFPQIRDVEGPNWGTLALRVPPGSTGGMDGTARARSLEGEDRSKSGSSCEAEQRCLEDPCMGMGAGRPALLPSSLVPPLHLVQPALPKCSPPAMTFHTTWFCYRTRDLA